MKCNATEPTGIIFNRWFRSAIVSCVKKPLRRILYVAINPEFGKRARVARARMDTPLTLEQIAADVGRRLGRDAPSPQAVGKWLAKGQEPDSFDVVRALAETLECAPAWLAFGDGSTVHSELPNTSERKETGLRPYRKKPSEANQPAAKKRHRGGA